MLRLVDELNEQTKSFRTQKEINREVTGRLELFLKIIRFGTAKLLLALSKGRHPYKSSVFFRALPEKRGGVTHAQICWSFFHQVTQLGLAKILSFSTIYFGV